MALNRMLKDIQRGLLVSPRHEQYLAKTQGDLEVNAETVAFVASQLSSGDRDRRMTFSASGRGNCLRQQIFGYLAFKGDRSFTSDQSATFIHGTWTHLKWQCMGLDAGWLARVEIPCSIDEYSLTGTIDGILDTGEGWELKSINSRGFRAICEYGPQTKHLYQIHSYMLATGISTWSLIYEDKDTQQWREWVVHRDQSVVDEIIEELEALKTARERQQLPLVLDSCVKHEGTTYKSCPYKIQCLEIIQWPVKTGIKVTNDSKSLTK